MSGRRARQARESRARLATIPACVCGYGWRDDPDYEDVPGEPTVIEIVPHAPDCAALVAAVALDQSGACPQCGYRYQQRHTETETHWRCPNGHGYGVTWRWPALERRGLGTVRRGIPRAVDGGPDESGNERQSQVNPRKRVMEPSV